MGEGAKRAKLKGLVRRALGAEPEAPRGEPSVEFEAGPHASGGVSSRMTVAPGTSVLEVAVMLDLDLDHFCGGNRSCGTCRVQIVSGMENLSGQLPGEALVLGSRHGPDSRLACQARVFGPVKVKIPAWF